MASPAIRRLQALNAAYASKGLAVLGSPATTSAPRDPAPSDEIKSFCSTTYGTDFELFEKVHAEQPRYVQPTIRWTPPVMWWNREFLVGKDGTVIGVSERRHPRRAQIRD